MAFFENRYYQVKIREDNGNFDVTSSQSGLPGIVGNSIHIKGFFPNGQAFSFQPVLNGVPDNLGEDARLGQVYGYEGNHQASGINWKVYFGLPKDSPLFFWRIELRNNSSSALFLKEISLLQASKPGSNNIFFPNLPNMADMAFYSNGWQSWSLTGAYAANARMRQSKLGILQKPIVYNAGTPSFRTRGKFSGDFFGVLGDRTDQSGLLLGFLSQKNHFGSLAADLRRKPQLKMWANGDEARLDPQKSISTDWAVMYGFHLDEKDPLAPYLQAVAEEHAISDLPSAMAGWCSWYYYYQNITPGIIRNNLHEIELKKEELPLDLVQIDDGFEAEVGDWLEFRPEFSEGVAVLAKEIKAGGFMPGLWLAPFILHPNSRIAVERPSWLLKQKNGNLAKAGFVWNTLGAALDLTVPEALEYACKVVDVAAHQWGYPYLKLDFLYAAALKGVYHDATQTRAQVLRSGMEAIRRTVGEDTILLGCGAPLGSVLGLVDAMRIGADVSPYWAPTYFGLSLPIKNEPHMPSVRNAIQNTLTRAALHGQWWVNDPDCLLVRPDSHLSLREVRSLATVIGMTGGSILLSDNMQALPTDRMEIAAALLPPIKKRVQVLDWMDAEMPTKLRLDLQGTIGDWHVLAYFNWQDDVGAVNLHANDFGIADQDYWVRSFWKNRVWRVPKGGRLYFGELHAHAPLLLAVRPFDLSQPAYLGSSLHISQGLEVSAWKMGKKDVIVELSPGRNAGAIIDIYLPQKPKDSKLDGESVPVKKMADDCYRYDLRIQKEGILKITY